MRVSYSALETYKSCPLKFKYQVLDKIKAPKSIEAVFGSAIHSSLKKIFGRSPLYPSLDEVVDYFADKLPQETPKEYLEEGISILKNFYKKNPPWNFNVVELESRFEVILDDQKNNESHVLAGIIDRIDKDPMSNSYEIIDYKTSKRMPSKDLLDQNLQLSIYNLGLLKKWPHLSPENIKLSLYYLKHNEKIETTRTSHNLEETKEKILEIIREIQNLIRKEKAASPKAGEPRPEGREFVPTPSALCDWCGYRKMCPMWRHLYVKPDDQLNSDQILSLIDEYFDLKGQNTLNNQRLKLITAQISDFMSQQGVSRVFGENGYLTRITNERTSHNLDKIKKILYDLGRWNEVVETKQYTTLKASRQRRGSPKGGKKEN